MPFDLHVDIRTLALGAAFQRVRKQTAFQSIWLMWPRGPCLAKYTCQGHMINSCAAWVSV